MKNIHLLATDKFQSIKLSLFENKLYLGDIASTALPQHIYITSEEEIKEGDWCLFNELEIVKCTYSKNGEYLFSNPLKSSSNHHFSYFKKIILTTDPDLIKNGVQAIPDKFLEWFVKNPNCEEVIVDKEQYHQFVGNAKLPFKPNYKIIIPKEETKQETLEEITEQIQKDCHKFVDSIISKVTYQDATNTFLFMKLAELTLKLKKYE